MLGDLILVVSCLMAYVRLGQMRFRPKNTLAYTKYALQFKEFFVTDIQD